MNTRIPSRTCFVALAVAAIAFSLGLQAQAQTESTIYNFTLNGPDGPVNPAASLIVDGSGNLYGTTTSGGRHGSGCNVTCGAIFELSPESGGGWLRIELYKFTGGLNGSYPNAALVLDAAGNLYGTTSQSFGGGGTIFEMSPNTDGSWSHKLLHEFSGGKDGAQPAGPLLFDSAGNLYGTTVKGGNLSACGGTGCGVVFELQHTAKGGWAEIVLHTFSGTDGENPYSGLTWDSAGNLYGTTYNGGNLTDCSGTGCGVVFRMVPVTTAAWKYTPIHIFTGGRNGANPFQETLVFDSAGALYGSTTYGGTSNLGIVFRLAQTPAGGWVETVLHSFAGGTDGAYPDTGVILGPGGTVYGTTFFGGSEATACSENGGCGTVFSLTPSGTSWTEQILFAFSDADGQFPYGLLLNGGNLYGTTNGGGGSGSYGVVYELTP